MASSPHPLAPPTSEGIRLSWLRLLRSRRVGPATFFRLMSEHDGSAEAALDALPAIARAAGLDDFTPCPADVARRELAAGHRAGAVPLFFGAPDYPAALLDLADPPPMLWALGLPALAGRPAIALVGARSASSLGIRMARSLARDLGAAGQVVVSGLARGIDAAAHETALETGTIAVVAGGVDVVYPPENADLAARIAAEGLILSEMPPGLQPQARHFPRRNRLISGLSRAVVVVEAAARSGSLITARDALDQGREVLAVPGHPLDPRAAGCNILLRDGATLVRGGDDVIEALGLPALARGPARSRAPVRPSGDGRDEGSAPGTRADPHAEVAPPPRLNSTGTAVAAATRATGGQRLRARILALLGSSPLAEDQILRDLAAPDRDIAEALLEMEIDGALSRQPGGLISRAG